MVKIKIFMAFLKLAEERGTANISLSMIAKELGMSKANIYTYFPDKETLLVEMMFWKSEQFHEKALKSSRKARTPYEKLEKVVVEIIEGERGFFKIFVDIVSNMLIKDVNKIAEMKGFRRKSEKIFTSILQEIKDLGYIRNEISVHKASIFLNGMLHATIINPEIMEEESANEVAKQIMDLMMNGISGKKQEDL